MSWCSACAASSNTDASDQTFIAMPGSAGGSARPDPTGRGMVSECTAGATATIATGTAGWHSRAAIVSFAAAAHVRLNDGPQVLRCLRNEQRPMCPEWTPRSLARRERFELPTPRFEVWCSIRLSYRRKSRKRMARPKRFELLTPRFVVWCSIQLSYGRVLRGALTPARNGR